MDRSPKNVRTETHGHLAGGNVSLKELNGMDAKGAGAPGLRPHGQRRTIPMRNGAEQDGKTRQDQAIDIQAFHELTSVRLNDRDDNVAAGMSCSVYAMRACAETHNIAESTLFQILSAKVAIA